MTDSATLLADLKKLLSKLETDLRERSAEVPALNEALRATYDNARQAERTALTFETWRDDYLTQAAVAWILACVFVRFIEDNGLIGAPLLAGSGERLQQAKDQRTLYFQQHPTDSDREYLHHVFHTVASLPAAGALFDERHNPPWAFGVSGDGATALIEFWQRIDPATGMLAHDFTDSEWNTRFLGDLYQDLSEAARKKYALLQTPEFVEEFILDRTLTPAIDEFGLADVRLIDPACGSGHFLLGAFHRLLALWQKREPAVNTRELTQRALDAVYGVDLNPFAVAIARFRLLLAALKASEIYRLADAPAFRINLAVGDSLLHGPRPGLSGARQMFLESDDDPLRHVYDTEDAPALRRILGGQYHVVVGNPPYITPKDAALNRAYRDRFESCHGKYSLAVPFMERFFDLAVRPANGDTQPAGYVGTITANSFMKREFGKKLIEQFIPRWDLTHVIDTSGAYIPGHGTPTVILFGRHRSPLSATVRAVLSIRGEPETPPDAAHGLVWSAIVAQVDVPGSPNDFISVADMARVGFHSHPWSIGGGGAAELKVRLEEVSVGVLEDEIESIGFAAITGEDEALLVSEHTSRRLTIPSRAFVTGEDVRDWTVAPTLRIVFPYRQQAELSPYSLDGAPILERYLWPVRTVLAARSMFGKSPAEHGLYWYEYLQFIRERIGASRLIAFAEVASHNHFVLDRGRKVFKQTAPVIKLHNDATDEQHLALLGLLNSSTSCFWMKQVSHQKQMTGGDGVRVEARSKVPYQFAGTQLGNLPIPDAFCSGEARQVLANLARQADLLADEQQQLSSDRAIERGLLETPSAISRLWSSYQQRRRRIRSDLIRIQEDIDFVVYSMFGLCEPSCTSPADDVPVASPVLEAGMRPFEIFRGANADGFDVTAEVQSSWPDSWRVLWTARIEAIHNSQALQLIEDAHYKRRWIGRQGLFNLARQADEWRDSCRNWLLQRLDSMLSATTKEELTTVAELADDARRDVDFMHIGELYRSRGDFDVSTLVSELLESESVPFLSVLRYKAAGLAKRAVWEQTWDLQRREDALDARAKLPEDDRDRLTKDEAVALKKKEIGDIPVPPKYTSADFLSSTFSRLRGKLDVPKERFISYPYAEREADPSLVMGWAGWDHLQQAKALAAYYVRMKENEGWAPERLQPLLAGLLELLPWLKQWHNELDPAYGLGMGDYFAGFVDEEARALNFTLDDLRNWQPPARKTIRRRKSRG